MSEMDWRGPQDAPVAVGPERTTRSYVFKKFRGLECGSPAGPGSNGRRPGKTLILKYDRAYIATSTSKGRMVLFSTGHLDRRGLECNLRENPVRHRNACNLWAI
jgi:hypothetical protein